MKTQITAKIIGLDEDLEKEHLRIKKQSDRALLEVGVELQNDLQEILRRDWYEKYKPTTYERRTDDPSLGRPIGSEENFDIAVRRQTLYFSFDPIGTHVNPEWSERHGNELIEWIQSEHNYADDDGEIIRKIPARPFWNNFLDEQMDGGIMKKFIRAMSQSYVIQEDGDEDFSELATEYLHEDIKVHSL